MTRIAAVHGVLAPHRHAQREITDMIARVSLPEGADRRVLDRLHSSARVSTRHTALPLGAYARLHDFGAVNDAFIEGAVALGAEAVGGGGGARGGAPPGAGAPARVRSRGGAPPPPHPPPPA
ncbi:type III polyketide synthase, partial [Streptomyces chryseus]